MILEVFTSTQISLLHKPCLNVKLYRREARTNIIENTVYSEYYLHCQLASYIKNELAEPYKDAEGKTQYQKILVKGFDVDQARPYR